MLCLVRGCFDRSVVGPVVGLGLELLCLRCALNRAHTACLWSLVLPVWL